MTFETNLNMIRSREEIEKESNKAIDEYPEDQYTQRKLIIELLLDIRDIVRDIYKEIYVKNHLKER